MNDKASHAPGPWIAKVHNRGIQQVETKDSIVIHWTGFDASDFGNPTCEANARLIAAAPDLLRACELLLMLSLPQDISGMAMVEVARQAVRRAKGEA